MNTIENYLDFSEEVKDAKAKNKPIVALESTIISHGMPYPQNLETAKDLENIVRDNNVTPATIAIINGRVKIGLDNSQLETLASEKNVLKVSRRDFPYVISQKKNGATTVAGTMIACKMAGLKIFATGGIGGVHRRVESSWDISADLQELQNTSVAVICAGVKSILDIPKTLEYLETSGVPVIGYSTDKFPAFYNSDSGLFVDYKIDDPKEIASLLKTKWDLGLNGGVLIANPINSKFEVDQKIINNSIEMALKEAKFKNISGKEITPYLLAKIAQITDGESLKSNIELVKSNVYLASKIAKSFY